MARQATESKSIPSKSILYTDPAELPGDYSSTPGGTLYSTTPGGTKIVYQKSVLMNLRNSPIAKTPPKWDIPDHLVKGSPPKTNLNSNNNKNKKKITQQRSPVISVNEVDDGDQFDMDI